MMMPGKPPPPLPDPPTPESPPPPESKPSPPPDPHQLQELGTDPATGKFRPAEAEAGARLIQRVGPLKRDPTGDADWVDADGKSYDAVGPVPKDHFNADSFCDSINSHMLKQDLDKVVV